MTREWLVYRNHAHAHAVWATATTDQERRAGALCVLRCEGLPDIESPRVCVLWTDGATAALPGGASRVGATIPPTNDLGDVSPIPEPHNGV